MAWHGSSRTRAIRDVGMTLEIEYSTANVTDTDDFSRESETGRGAEDFRAEIRRVVLSMNKAESFFVSRKRSGFMI